MRFFGIGFLVLIFLEIMSIVWVADWLGGGLTLLLMIASFFAGIFMLRNTGLSGILMAGATIRSGGDVSLYQLLWPIRYTVAAVLLMSPGFVSLLIALILLLPIKGKPIAQMNGTVFTNTQNPFQRPRRSDDEDIIEGEYTVDGNSRTNYPHIEHKPDDFK